MIYHGKRRTAFTMVEVLTILFGLGVAMTVGTVTLAGIFQVQKASDLSFRRTGARLALADQFRTDVNNARGLPKELGEAHAGESCLILRGNCGYIAYVFRQGRVERQEASKEGTVLHTARLGPQADGVRFSRDGNNLLSMSLEQSAEKPHDRRTWLFRAALGGNTR